MFDVVSSLPSAQDTQGIIVTRTCTKVCDMLAADTRERCGATEKGVKGDGAVETGDEAKQRSGLPSGEREHYTITGSPTERAFDEWDHVPSGQDNITEATRQAHNDDDRLLKKKKKKVERSVRGRMATKATSDGLYTGGPPDDPCGQAERPVYASAAAVKRASHTPGQGQAR
ncbi:hypothetical protein HPB50_004693 [Hyalomma asiaticum]|uniref:Uncharacterized protein n=1 Tax=Hyalomma asiaticum TaxID=266040 RepID=A0ACB7ST09_HYAAI|nr:hypothetical protein HPB50_004693 [Hyalomma asiaticum]